MRSLRALSLLVALAAGVAVTGCANGSQAALTVDGQTVTTQDQLFAQLNGSSGKPRSSYQTSDIAEVLTGEARSSIVQGELDRRGIQPSADDSKQAQAALGQGATQATVSAKAKELAIGRVLAEEAFRAGEADRTALARQLYDQRKDQLGTPAQTCVSAIAVFEGGLDPQTGQPVANPTAAQVAAAKAKAAEAKGKLDSGTAWVDVVKAYSDISEEQAAEGKLGCVPDTQLAQQLGPDLAAAVGALSAGQATAPVESTPAVVILRLDERQAAKPAPPFEQVQKDAELAVTLQLASKKFDTWYTERARTANVVVDPRYGSWDVNTGTVVPPEGAATPTTPTTSLDSLVQQLGLDQSGSGSSGAGSAGAGSAGAGGATPSTTAAGQGAGASSAGR